MSNVQRRKYRKAELNAVLRVSALTNKLMVRVTNYFDTQIRLPFTTETAPQFPGTNTPVTSTAFQTNLQKIPAKPGTSNEQRIHWYARIFEGVKLRYRKLQRLAR